VEGLIGARILGSMTESSAPVPSSVRTSVAISLSKGIGELVGAQVQVVIFGRAVSLQVERVTSRRPRPGGIAEVFADAYLLAFALRDLLRAAELVHKLAGGTAVEQAIGKFLDAVPDVKQARDVLEHFDEYLVGKGRDPAARGDFQPSITDRTGDGVSLEIGPYRIDVTRASEAASKLTVALLSLTPEVRRAIEGR
jgi:hypothetical protein